MCIRDRVKSSLTHLSYRAEELACQAAFFGHTHRAFCGYVGGALLLNPGDVSYTHLDVYKRQGLEGSSFFICRRLWFLRT